MIPKSGHRFSEKMHAPPITRQACSTRTFSTTRRDGVARITINRPAVMNAFRGQTCEELIAALNRAGWDKAIGVIVLAGAGDRAFCTGGDQTRARRPV